MKRCYSNLDTARNLGHQMSYKSQAMRMQHEVLNTNAKPVVSTGMHLLCDYPAHAYDLQPEDFPSRFLTRTTKKETQPPGYQRLHPMLYTEHNAGWNRFSSLAGAVWIPIQCICDPYWSNCLFHTTLQWLPMQPIYKASFRPSINFCGKFYTHFDRSGE